MEVQEIGTKAINKVQGLEAMVLDLRWWWMPLGLHLTIKAIGKRQATMSSTLSTLDVKIKKQKKDTEKHSEAQMVDDPDPAVGGSSRRAEKMKEEMQKKDTEETQKKDTEET